MPIFLINAHHHISKLVIILGRGGGGCLFNLLQILLSLKKKGENNSKPFTSPEMEASLYHQSMVGNDGDDDLDCRLRSLYAQSHLFSAALICWPFSEFSFPFL